MTTATTNPTAAAAGMPEAWRSRAACLRTDPEVFFPTPEWGPVYQAQVAVAKAVCAGCPVRSECLTEALARIPFGIAGGLTPEERRGRRTRPVGAEPGTVLEAGLRPDATRAELEAAGRVLLTAGRPIREVAHRCGVSERTASRWAASARAASPEATTAALEHDHQAPDDQAEGSRGGNRAPLLISQQHNPLAGTRAAEGHRS